MNIDLPPIALTAGLSAFFLALSIMGVIGFLMRKYGKIGTRIQKASTGERSSDVNLFRQEQLSDIDWVNSLLKHLPFVRSVHRLLLQASVPFSVNIFFILCIAAPICSYLILKELISYPWIVACCSAGVAAIPWIWVTMRKDARRTKFLEQLPDALDALARALRAGHALNSGLRILADEYGKPLGEEFKITLQEINLGMSMEKALTNLMERVDLPSLRFFAVSLIIQREVGGNLAEIVETISYLVREHYKLIGRVRVLSAEGRFSAIVFILLPIAIAGAIFYLNPTYLNLLITHPQGNIVLKVGLFLMVCGVFTMYRMIKIKV
ncbi:type II secretion system F family protein [Halodesulfovibrio aestuarii]|uniref:Type II secretion system F family protein n=1 Tax=Halodesulfovibrio aestuarii TaxID=126333 RepID=A0ABV4JPZ1_9BACT